MLAGSMAVVAAPTLLVAAEEAGLSVVGAVPPAECPVSPVVAVVIAPSQDQPGAATVVPEGVVRSVPLEAPMEVDATTSCREQPDTAMVVSKGVVQSVPSEAQVETTAATTSPVGLGVTTVASEGVTRSAPLVDPPVVLEAAQREEDPVGGSSGVVAEVRRTRRESPPTPLSGGSRSPTWGEPPLQWMDAQDPMSALFMLDDHSESMEQESLDFGLSTMMNDLDQVRGALCEIVVPTS